MKFFSFFLLFLLMNSCAEKNSEELVFKSETIPKIFKDKNTENFTLKSDTLFLNNQKFSGYLFELNSNKTDTLSSESYFDGLQSGKSKKWYDNKQLMELRNYYQGKKNGKQIAYWENGDKKFEFTAINDACEGEMKEWNSDGKLIHLANYKDGQEEGTQKLWYDNGKIRANYVILNGKRYGLLGTKNCKNVSDSVFVVK